MMSNAQDALQKLRRAHLLSPGLLSAGSFLALTQTNIINAGGLEPAIAAGIGAAAFAVLNVFSQKIPYSQREHLVLVPEAIEQSIGAKSFDQVKQQYGRDILPKDHKDAQLVERIAERVVNAVKKADTDVDGYTAHMRDYEWEVFAVRSKTPNAFVVPGGKIVVFTGLMDILGRDEDELAVVVAHEVAHVVARHSAERLGLKLLTQVASAAITYYVLSRMQGQQRGGQRQQQQQQRGGFPGRGGGFPGRGGFPSPMQSGLGAGPLGGNNQIISGAVSQGAALLVELPGSRRHEMEADLVGLKLAGLAGFDIRKAPKVWEQMASMEGGKAPAAWMSTHPSSDKRQAVLRRELELMKEHGLKGESAFTRVFAETSYFAL